MKRFLNTLLFAAVLAIVFNACSTEDSSAADDTKVISDEVLAQIKHLGFSTDNVIKEEGGYIVEGDIFLPEEDLKREDLHQHDLRVADTEQYRTTNLVTGLPREITVRVVSTLGTKYINATDAAIARYNALGLRITFRRVTSGGNIVIKKAPNAASYLASAGFPTSGGAPYSQVLINSTYLNTNSWNNASITSILAHEIGHCVGFRHTDYMDRSYSCGGSYYNEGASTVGAILIPGTPSTADPNSWMLACIGKNVDRPFNSNDVTALEYLY